MPSELETHESGNSPVQSSENQSSVQGHQTLLWLTYVNIFDIQPASRCALTASVHVTFVQLDFICQVGLSREDIDILGTQPTR